MHLNYMCMRQSKTCKYMWESQLKKNVPDNFSFPIGVYMGWSSEKEIVACKSCNIQSRVFLGNYIIPKKVLQGTRLKGQMTLPTWEMQ